MNLIEIATRVMLGESVSKPDKTLFDLDHIGIKASQFSFSRLSKADPVLGVEMASTGEVGCMGHDFDDALLKAMLSVGYRIPQRGVLISSGPARAKLELLEACKLLQLKGIAIFATMGTANFLKNHGILAQTALWPDEIGDHNSIDLIASKKVDMVINIPKDLSHNELQNDYTIRRAAIDYNIPLLTNDRLASAFIQAFCTKEISELEILPWNHYK